MPTLKGVSRGQPTPPDHHRGHARRRAGADTRSPARRRLAAAPARGARRGRRGRPGAGRGGSRARRRAVLGGAGRHRPRARRRRLRIPGVGRGVRGVRAPLREADREGSLAGGARDARDRRLPRAALAAGDRAHPRRQRRRRRRRARRARARRRGRPRERVRCDPLSHDPALRADLRSRIARRTSAGRRPGRRRARDPRAARTGRREAPRLAAHVTWRMIVTSSSVV